MRKINEKERIAKENQLDFEINFYMSSSTDHISENKLQDNCYSNTLIDVYLVEKLKLARQVSRR